MAREDHQPVEGPVVRSECSREEMRAACGRTIAFVLALEKGADGSDPDVVTAITSVKRTGMAAAIVLTVSALAEAAIDATRNAGKKGNTFVQALEYDPAAAIPLTREAGDFELFNLPYGLLVTAHAVATGLLDDCDGVLFMDAAQSPITADQVYELCCDAREHPDAEVVVSRIQQQHCMPCWISRAFLDRLVDRDPALINAGEMRQEPCIRTRPRF